jgi:choline dehydrogenase-like flavoprotein
LHHAPYLARATAWRYLRDQLYWPSPARYELHVVGEQLPHRNNRIALGERVDVFGNPLAVIDWRRRPEDFAPFLAYRRRLSQFWKRQGLAAIAELEWMTEGAVPEQPDASGASDIYHPCCSTRMGSSATTAVVDKELQVFSLPNLWLASTSVFPSGASANPTLTLMLLTLRLAERLVRAGNCRLSAGGGGRSRSGNLQPASYFRSSVSAK